MKNEMDEIDQLMDILVFFDGLERTCRRTGGRVADGLLERLFQQPLDLRREFAD